MIGARRYPPSSLVTSAMACVCESWLCIQATSSNIHKSCWSRSQRLASVNRGYVYFQYTLVTLATACVCESWLCIQGCRLYIHKSTRLDWSRPQRLAFVNRGYVYRAAGSIYINRVGHPRNGLRL